MKPNLDNEFGFWEHDEIVACHEELLKNLNYSWDGVDELPQRWFDTMAAKRASLRLDEIVEKDFHNQILWGVKDPRLCRLLPLWRPIFTRRDDKINVLMIIRHPVEVSESLAHRDGFSRAKSELLWLRHVLEAERNSRGLPRTLVKFDDLLANWKRTIRNSSEQLDLVWPESIDSAATHIDQFLINALHHHHWQSAEQITTPFSSMAAELYDALRINGFLDAVPLQRLCDEISARLARSQEEILDCLLEHPRTSGRALLPLWKAVRTQQENLGHIVSNGEKRLIGVGEQLDAISMRVVSGEAKLAQWQGVSETNSKELGNAIQLVVAQLASFEKRVGAAEEHLAKLRVAVEANSERLNNTIQSIDLRLKSLGESFIEESEAHMAGLQTTIEKTSEGLTNAVQSVAMRLTRLEKSIVDEAGARVKLATAVTEINHVLPQHIERYRQRWSIRYWLSRVAYAIHGAATSANDTASVSTGNDVLRQGIKYSLDSLKYKDKTVFGFGWVFHEKYQIAGISLLTQYRKNSERIKCIYGGHREDVARDYPSKHALGSGFWFNGSLQIHADSKLWLEVSLQIPETQVVLLPIPSEVLSQPSRAGFRAKWLRRGRRAASLVKKRQFSLLLRLLLRYGKQRILAFPRVQRRKGNHRVSSTLKQIGSNGEKVTLVLDHDLGGGANFYREQMLRDQNEAGYATILVTFRPATHVYNIMVVGRNAVTAKGESYTLKEISQLLRTGPLNEIFVNNLYSFPNVLASTRWLGRLIKKHDAKLTVAIHDFLSVCPSYNLIDWNGRYCDIPAISVCEKCLSLNDGEFTSFVHNRNIHLWRASWERLLNKADKLICFSQNSATLLRRTYPGLRNKEITIKPHHLQEQIRKPRLSKGYPVIGVVGGINRNKGAEIVREMEKLISKNSLPAKIVIIGTIEGLPENSAVLVHGPYKRADLPGLLEKYGVNICLFPSIWPETFSYVCEELMHMRVPLVVFDVGAPPERVRQYPVGYIVRNINASSALEGVMKLHEQVYGSAYAQNAGDRINSQPAGAGLS